MRLAALGGPYANPYALRAVLADARARGAQRVLNLGDIGGFGAEVDACWELLTAPDVTSIAGNYDIAIGRGDEDCGCGYTDPRDNELAQVVYDLTRAATSPAFAAWMRGLPGRLRLDMGGLDVLAVHGSPLDVADFLWESLPDDELALRVRAGGSPDVLLCTHTGIPWQRRVDGTLVVNVGAVGRPANDGTPDARYALLDVEDGRACAELVRVPYDWRAQAASMRAGGLPEPFVETVETGWWTTCLEVVPPAERARGRFHVYRDALPAPAEQAEAGWADPVAAPEPDERPVVPLFGTALFPPRLWAYTTFTCNLSCGYCVVASSPRARPRQLELATLEARFDEAVEEGFRELYLTGGEPFAHPDAEAIVEAACARPFDRVVVLTNAMLFTGRRRGALERLARHPQLVLQSSLDSATPAAHDAQRGAGSWAAALDGLRRAHDLGLPLRVALTETPATRGEGAAVAALLDGVAEVAVRPLVARGLSAAGAEVSDAVVVPELTVTADGLHWHPLGGDVDAAPDFVVARGPDVPLAEGKRLVVQRFLERRREDGTLPEAFACAV